MKKNVYATITALICAALCQTANAAAETSAIDQGAGPAFFFSHDNENFTTRRVAVEYLPDFQNVDALTGVRFTEHTYKQDGWQRDGQQVTLMTRHRDPATYNGWQLDAGVFHQDDHNLLTLDGGWRQQLTQHTGLELFINRDWVETHNALDRGIHFTFGGASIEQGFGDHVTLIGLAGYQDFSDGNKREHARLKLVYQPWLDQGLTLQARYRRYHSDADDVGGAYFNPKHYDESMLALGWRKRFMGWTGSLTAGAGIQHVNDDPQSNTRLLEIAVQSPIRGKQSLSLSGGYNQSASFNGPDYRYRYIQGEWILRF